MSKAPASVNPRIPWSTGNKSEYAQQLNEAVGYAATEAGITARQAAMAMSAFLENVADQVARGRTFNIPGFGLWGPKAVLHKHQLRGRAPFCRPLFRPSRGFIAQVRFGTGPNPEAEEKLRTYQRNHTTGHAGSRRTFACQQRFRDMIRAQMEGERRRDPVLPA